MEKYRYPEHEELFECWITGFYPREESEWFDPEYMKQSDFVGSGFLLLDFELLKPIKHDLFLIEPSIHVQLPRVRNAFIAPVQQLPRSKDESDDAILGSWCFSMGLSVVVSLVTSRCVKASTDYIANKNVDRNAIKAAHASTLGRPVELKLGELATFDLLSLAVQHPVSQIKGLDYTVSKATRESWAKEITETADALLRIPQSKYNSYVSIMRAARLVQYAHLNRAEDIGLAYYFLVSAIESVSSEAIRTKDVRVKQPLEAEWKKIAEEDKNVKPLYDA